MKNIQVNLRPLISADMEHPIQSGEYLVGTYSTFEMLKVISGWIDARQPGGIIYGHPRAGKSSAIKYVRSELSKKFKNTLPVVSFICKEHEKNTENIFFEELLESIGHAVLRKGTAAEKRARLKEYLISLALKNTHRRIVLFFDEAHLLKKINYNWLVDIFNELDALRIKPTFVMIGQNELKNLREVFIQAKYYQIVGRFMLSTHRFQGLRGPKDIEVCLHSFDKNTEYPAGSQCTYTQYYFPVAYSHGWRLVSQTELIWKAFCEIKEKYKLPTSEITMNYFFMTLEYVLQHYENLIDIELNLSLKVWKEGIIKSGYPDSGNVVVNFLDA